MMDEQRDNPTDGEINIEAIMIEIRQQLMNQEVGPGSMGVDIPLSGERFSPEFYERLYLAGLAINDAHIYLEVTDSKIPLFGPLIDRLRRALHQLVIFYVHRAADRQAEVNRNLLKAISEMSTELENERASLDA